MKLLNFFLDPETRDKKEFLRHLSLFQGLRNKDILHIIRNLQERTFLKGETIFAQGDVGRALFIVASGNIQLTRMSADSKPEMLATVHPGEFFGEMALLEEMPRTATATASENSKIYILYKVKLESMLYSSPRVGVVITTHLAKMLSSRLRSFLEAKNSEPAPIKT